ncbi:MAG TPA: NYN domain-containing protein, partial [Rhodospirillales bacterium]
MDRGPSAGISYSANRQIVKMAGVALGSGMAETIKSALLLDYEGLHRSISGVGGANDSRLADRAAAWLAAIETGRLIGPPGTRRRLVSKRCYAGPTVLGKNRDALGAAGFEVIDCGPNDSSGRSPADIHITIDTIEAMAKPDGVDEFILMSASSDLAPLLGRLKASKRLATIYADSGTPDADKALADALLDRTAFVEFLSSNEVPVGEDKNARTADRAEIEEFARRIHAATNIPLFSPKTYAELFRHLTDEIRENGYHFQTTARRVAERMTAAGRNVTRRQVVFIVKGLALKGHVFSTSDTADGLAEVFREQARYLVTNAGIDLDERQGELLNAWFVSHAPPNPPTKPKTAAEVGGQNGSKPPPPRAPAAEPKPAAARQGAAARETSAPVKTPPAAAKPAPIPVKPVELPKSTAKPSTSVKSPSSPAAREEAKAVIAARIAASARLKPSSRTAPAKPAAKAPVTNSQPEPRKKAADQASNELETSILAAIAEAVDVLVDDRANEEASATVPPKRR